ncbi:MAG: family 78 glycoside hydrolase catalytic domain [Anaerolineales bacterium]|nr:family 78 glycoside hydrolase catalytic domain [Anaerolineales bacterium]
MQTFARRAEWIWRQRGLAPAPFGTANPRLAAEANRYIYFRRSFTIAAGVAAAQVSVSADGRYQLFVNGRFVGRGPARCNPARQCVDSYDIAPYLQSGSNVIAALVHSYGRHTAWYELPTMEHTRAFGCGGFFLQGEVSFENAHPINSPSLHLDTGKEWRYLESAAWQRDAPNGSLGYVEIYDARRAPEGWRDVDFDDSEWQKPEILRVAGRNGAADTVPFPVMVPRAIPPLHEEIRHAHALCLLGEVRNALAAPEIAALFAQEMVMPLDHCRVQGAENLRAPDGVTDITTTAERSVSLVLDFGQTVIGRVCFDVEGSAGAAIDFTYGERLAEDGRVHMHEGIPGFDVRPGHRLILRDGRQQWEAFEMSGFRYLQVTVRQCERPLQIHTVALNFSTYPVSENGRFTCSDPLLNHIWQAGANTSRLCMLDGHVDCPSREQRQWMSAYTDVLISFAANGDAALAAQLLRQVAQSQQADGLTMMVAPGDFAVMNFTNIPDFCLHWIMTIGVYVEYSGDTDIVNELYPAVIKAIDWFERHLNEENLLTDVPHWVFVDWAALDKQGQVTALNAHFAAALRTAAKLARWADHPANAQRFEQMAVRTATAVNELLWDETRGVYADSRRNDILSRRISQQSNVAAIAFGVAPPERWPRIFAVILDAERLVLTPAGDSDPAPLVFDDETDVVLAQPFYMHFVHRALRMAGKQQAILDNIRRYWGQMLAAGEQTVWETWQATGVLSSKCHAWAATPTFDLSTDVLGVTPTGPGFRTFRVAPQPGDLTWARGAFPTPHGNIEVDWRLENGRFALNLTVPENTEAEVMLPGWETAVLVGPDRHQMKR